MTEENKPKINLEEVMKSLQKEEDLKNPEIKQQTEKEDLKQEEEITKLKNELLLALAENQNLRKRHLKEREDLSKFAISSALNELAVPFEHIFTALKLEMPEELKSNSFVNSMLEGVTMVQKEFEKVFFKLGLKRISPQGEKFDPNLHQAVAQVEVENTESGVVIQVVSAGFELNGRILKPAMVVVSK